MDWDRIEGNWKQVKATVKEKWGKLTDDDLDVINGRRNRLESKIQQRYGFATDHVRQEVDDWFRWQDSGRPSPTTAIPMQPSSSSGVKEIYRPCVVPVRAPVTKKASSASPQDISKYFAGLWQFRHQLWITM